MNEFPVGSIERRLSSVRTREATPIWLNGFHEI
jgi:hypothetical protein